MAIKTLQPQVFDGRKLEEELLQIIEFSFTKPGTCVSVNLGGQSSRSLSFWTPRASPGHREGTNCELHHCDLWSSAVRNSWEILFASALQFTMRFHRFRALSSIFQSRGCMIPNPKIIIQHQPSFLFIMPIVWALTAISNVQSHRDPPIVRSSTRNSFNQAFIVEPFRLILTPGTLAQ